MTALFRWQGQGRAIGVIAAPASSGFGDIGSAVSDSLIAATTAAPRMDVQTHTMSGRSVRTLRTFDSAAGGDLLYWSIRPSVTPFPYPATYTGPWSARMYLRMPSPLSALSIISFRDAGAQTIGFTRAISTDRLIRTGSGSGITLPSPSLMYRLEIQADPSRTPNFVWRLYREDELIPVGGFAETVTSVAWDELRLGFLTSGFYAQQFDFADIEIHDDYTLNGQFRSGSTSGTTPATATAQGVPSWLEFPPSRFNVDPSTFRTLARSTPTFTTYSNVAYTTAGTFGRNLDLYVPTGTPPAGGWPVVVWAHQGFFSENTKAELPTTWRNDLLAAGYAVATVQYVKTTIDLIPTYDAYGTTDSDGPGFGRYPSFILDFKRAAAFLRDNFATYSLNPTKMFASGYSAGGYIALAAAMTRGLATDSAGTPMTLDGARLAGAAWADGYTGADPSFLGCLVFAAPVDMDLARNWDPTHPNTGSLIRRTAYRAFQGLIVDGSTSAPLYPQQSIASHISLNSLANLCPVAYVRGSADYLVHWEHEAALEAALVAKGVPFTEFVTPNNHDDANRIYDIETHLAFLNPLAYPTSPTLPNRTVTLTNGSTESAARLSRFDGSAESASSLTG